MSTTRASTPSKGELTRRAILDAAIARFGRDGYRATSVADIARDASVGGTVAYAYFPNKEALFLAAVDHDAAAVIVEGVSHILEDLENDDWRGTLVFTLVDAVDRHPLARRLLAGLEPEVTARVMDIPALHELRKACAERLRTEQATGRVRPDIDAVARRQRHRDDLPLAAASCRADRQRRHGLLCLGHRRGFRSRPRPGTPDRRFGTVTRVRDGSRAAAQVESYLRRRLPTP